MDDFIRDTEAFVQTLVEHHPEAWDLAQAHAHRAAYEQYGESLTVLEWLLMAKGVRAIAAVDGLSRPERFKLAQLMKLDKELPDVIETHLASYTPELTDGLLPALARAFEPGSRKAKRLLCAAIEVAMMDGFSDHERELACQLARRLGLRDAVVDAYEARVRAERIARQHGDPELTKQMKALRLALWDLS